MYDIYTDGGCSNNKRGEGLGGFGAVILESGKVVKRVGGYKNGTTNNRMELWAASAGLKTVEILAHKTYSKKDMMYMTSCTVHSDSKYVVSNLKYAHIWKDNGWKKSNGKDVLNVDLWKKLVYYETRFKHVAFKWVRGHNGNQYNEEADAIATKFVTRLKRQLK